MKLTTTGFMLTAALALPASMLPASSASAQVGLGVSVNFGPPPLPVYEQPELPAPGYLWTPGYWAYGPYGYYWVPGAWVLPPSAGLLWTPGYWAWYGGGYRWNRGYWGPRVGFYGGINYGHGYPGRGYYGGRWDHGRFYYNRDVARVDPRRVRYTYSNPVRYENRGGRTSYNGGRGGIELRPSKQEQTWARERHPGPTGEQSRQRQTAMKDPSMSYKNNHGKPPAVTRMRPLPPPMQKPNQKQTARPPHNNQPPHSQGQPKPPPSRHENAPPPKRAVPPPEKKKGNEKPPP